MCISEYEAVGRSPDRLGVEPGLGRQQPRGRVRPRGQDDEDDDMVVQYVRPCGKGFLATAAGGGNEGDAEAERHGVARAGLLKIKMKELRHQGSAEFGLVARARPTSQLKVKVQWVLNKECTQFGLVVGAC